MVASLLAISIFCSLFSVRTFQIRKARTDDNGKAVYKCGHESKRCIVVLLWLDALLKIVYHLSFCVENPEFTACDSCHSWSTEGRKNLQRNTKSWAEPYWSSPQELVRVYIAGHIQMSLDISMVGFRLGDDARTFWSFQGHFTCHFCQSQVIKSHRVVGFHQEFSLRVRSSSWCIQSSAKVGVHQPNWCCARIMILWRNCGFKFVFSFAVSIFTRLSFEGFLPSLCGVHLFALSQTLVWKNLQVSSLGGHRDLSWWPGTRGTPGAPTQGPSRL